MKRIGLLSDTHSYIDEPVFKHFKDCDEIWHAGDIGNFETYKTLASFKPLSAVYGNIDNHEIRQVCKEVLRFKCEDVNVLIKHITGYPNRYDKIVKSILDIEPPNLLIGGHSHILKVIYDKKYNLLFINPGAAGKNGIHKVRTFVRFTIDKSDIKDLEVVEIKR